MTGLPEGVKLSMSHSLAHKQRCKGLILPLTMVLLAFGTTMIIIAGLQVSRTTSRLNNYETMSDLQLAATNVVEVATSYLIKNFSDFTGSPWDEFGSFVEYVSGHGGLEGIYWSEVLETLEPERFWNLKDKVDHSLINNNGKFLLGAVAVQKNDGYFVIGWAEHDNTRRYAAALVIPEMARSLPAMRIGNLERNFGELKTIGNGNKQYFKGDLIYGNAIIADVVNIVLTDDPENIFKSNIEANDIVVGEAYESYKTSDKFKKITLDKTSYFNQIKNDHLAELVGLTPQIADGGTIDISNDDILIEVFPGFDEVEMNFADSGLTMKYGSNTIFIPATPYRVNIRIYGNVQIGRDQDSHKINKVNGNYSITVDGDIQVHSNILYSDLIDSITDKSDSVITKTISNIAVLAHTLSETPSNNSLKLASIGGNMIFRYGQGGMEKGNSSHGVRVINANLMAFENNGHGGHFTFPDLSEALGGNSANHIPQMLTVGSFTGLDMGGDGKFDLVDQFVIVSDESRNSNIDSQLALVGIRVW